MKKLLISFLLLSSPAMAQTKNMQKRLDSLLAFYHGTFDFNGSILVSKNGKVLVNKGFGYRNKEQDLPNTSESIFMIGSVTKQFTAEVILMLASEGPLALDDRLSKYYKNYRSGDSITIINLLSHTSGIPDYTQDDNWQKGNLTAVMPTNDVVNTMLAKPLEFSPGKDFNYSNTNYLLLGLIIEQVTGKSYYANVCERIFKPLGMTHSGFDLARLRDHNKTTGYYYVQNDTFIVAPVVDSTQTNSAGSIYSTTGDMLKWHNALQKYKLLPRQWQDKMFEPVLGNYGYGIELDSLCGLRLLHHSGHIHGYNSNFYHLPNENVCVVVLTNLMKTGADPVPFARDAVRAMYDADYHIPAVRKEVKVSLNTIKRYEGVYTPDADTSMHFALEMRKDQLYLTLTGQRPVPLLPQSETMFFTKVVDAQIEFKPIVGGGYDMVLYQNGEEMIARKK